MQSKDYSTLNSEYLSTGLTHTLIHMIHRFCVTVKGNSKLPSFHPEPWELREVVLRLHINEMELALMYFYYGKTHARVTVYNKAQLLLLCGYHAKDYLNSSISLYKSVIDAAFPQFSDVYREFANLHCLQYAVDPMSLNASFVQLRQTPVAASHMVFDLNHQADLLTVEEGPADKAIRDLVAEKEDSTFEAVFRWKVALPGTSTQTDSLPLPPVPTTDSAPESVPPDEKEQDDLAVSRPGPSSFGDESMGVTASLPDELAFSRNESFFSDLQLARNNSYFSQLQQDHAHP